LTRPFDKHLDSDELDSLISLQGTNVSGSAQLSAPVLREAQRHVESCQDCSRKLQRHQFVHSEILRMRVHNPSPSTPECMGDAEWLEVAAGLLPEAKTRELMKHAAQCRHCGPLLKNAAEALVDEATPSEEALLVSLQSARPEWRKNMAATLQDSMRDRQPMSSWWRTAFAWPAPAYAFAGIVAVAVVAWIGLRALHPPSAEQLLAQAYSEHRTLEVRIPGARYAPMQAERGTAQSDFDKPHSLLKAKDLIGEALNKNPSDPKWLQARARAELLDGNYESAIKSLQRALETQPDSPSLLTDLGSAYFVRAESANRPIDYGNAIESFGKALAKSPEDPIALFNRALACEHMFLYTQAVDDWEHYLHVDPQSEWADDARRRLSALREKIEQHDKSSNEPLLNPNQIANASAHGIDLSDQLDKKIEDYLVLATTDWLPKAYPVDQTHMLDARESRSALEVLAGVLKSMHRDTWLEDLLSIRPSHSLAQAVEDLAVAIRADDRGDNVLALQRSHEAEQLFAAVGNDAGTARARVESMFAAHDAQDADACMNALNHARTTLDGQTYRWLAIQFHIEEGTCYGLAGDLGRSRQFYEQAASDAKASNYRVIYMRTQDHLSGIDSEDGNLSEGWVRAQHGLAKFWSAPCPPMRGYNFYFDLDEFARVSSQPHLQMAVWRDGIALSNSFEDKVIRAMSHSFMADAAVAAGQLGPAAKEFALTGQLLEQAPQIRTTRIARIEAESRLAEIEVADGKPELAVARLQKYSSSVEQLSDNVLSVLYETALGNAQEDSGQNAEAALRSALAVSALYLDSIPDERRRMEWIQRTANTYRCFSQFRLLHGDTMGALEAWEWYRGAALRVGRKLDGTQPSWVEPPPRVAGTLPGLTDITFISYALLPRGLAIWVYDNRGVFSYWSETNTAALSEDAANFRALCADSGSSMADLQRRSASLFKTLVAPIEGHLSADRTLVIELDDGLSGLPFEALLDSQNRYLGDRYSAISSLGVYYQPSTRKLRAIHADSFALAVAVPASNAAEYAPTPPLPDALSEGEWLARSFGNARLLKESGATVENVRAELPAAEIFHFAGHAISSPVRSGLLLSDGLLNAASLEKLSLARMQLAVLSACDTQDGSNGGATSADSLVRAFQRAGAARVVASRWNVDSRVTREFMELFYRALLSGNTVAGSIHQAQSALRSQPGLAHPYYWSAFTAFGAV
jgi:CHAT domain-containing protein/tetratricopeptide (TPR) repeat protein